MIQNTQPDAVRARVTMVTEIHKADTQRLSYQTQHSFFPQYSAAKLISTGM